MYLENDFSMQAAQCTLPLQQEIVERRRASVAAQAANRAKSAFLANMSHELRSPLNLDSLARNFQYEKLLNFIQLS